MSGTELSFIMGLEQSHGQGLDLTGTAFDEAEPNTFMALGLLSQNDHLRLYPH